MTPRDAADDVLDTLRNAGHVAYLAGGCVRDTLLGLEPRDYDVATDAPPDRVRTLFPRSNAVGAAFGVVLVHHGRGGSRVTTEVATFREDGTYGDGRRPDSVAFTDARHDAHRRDFTINGLFATGGGPDARGLGRVVDFVGGQADLREGVLRAIGDASQRFEEDRLRVLRAARFAARFGLSMDPATEAAARAAAPKTADLAPERVADELRRITGHDDAGAVASGLAWLHRLAVWPTLVDPVYDRGWAAEDLAGLAAVQRLAVALLGVLPDPSDPQAARAVGRRLRLSNPEAALLRDASACVWELGLWDGLGVAGRKRLASRPGFAVAVRLRRDVAVESDAAALAADGIGLRPPPLLSGDALVAAGVRPGPAMGRVLAAVYDLQLAGGVRDAEAALAAGLDLVGGGP